MVGGWVDPATPTPPKPTYTGDTYTYSWTCWIVLHIGSNPIPDDKMVSSRSYRQLPEVVCGNLVCVACGKFDLPLWSSITCYIFHQICPLSQRSQREIGSLFGSESLWMCFSMVIVKVVVVGGVETVAGWTVV